MFELPSYLWEPQVRGITGVIRSWLSGKTCCLYGPTGSGKTTQAATLFQWAKANGLNGVFYVNRRLLIQQTVDRFRRDGLQCAIRAAGFEDEFDFSSPFQVASADTERARVIKSGKWVFHDAQVVIIDEAHLQKTDTMKAIIDHYKATGAHIVGLTATPIGLSEWFDELILSGTLEEFRNCGAIVHADVYSIGMPDMRKVKRNHTGEFVMDGEKKRIYTQSIVKDVFKMWERLNPEQKPTMLFAPGVAESVWLTEQFRAKGINWAHVDATDCIVDGERRKLDIPTWLEIQQRVKDGEIKGISNRFKCFDAQTDILTIDGWKPGMHVRLGEVVRTFDSFHGEFRWQKVYRKIEQTASVMVSFKSADASSEFRVTFDHEVLHYDERTARTLKTRAMDLNGLIVTIPSASHDGSGYDLKRFKASLEISDSEPVWCVSVPDTNVVVRRTGSPVVCGNCREGLDIPQAYNAILATPIGSLASYLQIVGRVLRAHPTKDRAVIGDHGGAFWRLGSPNEDRDWAEWWSLPEHAVSEMHQNQIREKKASEPICCPNCQMERTGGFVCPGCGHKAEKSRRIVIMEDGEMKQYDGKLMKPKFVKREPDTEQIWTGMAHGWRRKKVDRTWNQLAGFFCHEHGYHPPKDLKMMPKKAEDWYRPVHAVDIKDLY